MLEVLNDPIMYLAMSLVVGMFGSLVIVGIVLSFQVHMNYLRRPKHGASKMSDRVFAQRLREASRDQVR